MSRGACPVTPANAAGNASGCESSRLCSDGSTAFPLANPLFRGFKTPARCRPFLKRKVSRKMVPKVIRTHKKIPNGRLKWGGFL